MKKRKKLWDLLPLMLLWLMLCVLVWGCIFNFLTDVPAENKLVIFVDAASLEEKAINLALEEHLSGNIEMVRVYPFTYAMMDSTVLEAADLFVVPASAWEEYAPWFRALPEEAADWGEVLTRDGVALGVRVHAAGETEGAGASCIAYAEEDYYLFFGKRSTHLDDNEGAVDNEAIRYAEAFIALP